MTRLLHSTRPSDPAIQADLVSSLMDLARASAGVANYCDHLEHCEAAQREDVASAAVVLRRVARELAALLEGDLLSLYASRLAAVEARSPLYPLEGFDVVDEVRRASTWFDLQRVQARHDRLYHLDVVGLQKQDQLRHCALHLAKLTGALADAITDSSARDDFVGRRLPDLILFSLKLNTLLGQRAEGPLDIPTLR